MYIIRFAVQLDRMYPHYFDTFKMCVVQYSQVHTYIFMKYIILIINAILCCL